MKSAIARFLAERSQSSPSSRTRSSPSRRRPSGSIVVAGTAPAAARRSGRARRRSRRPGKRASTACTSGSAAHAALELGLPAHRPATFSVGARLAGHDDHPAPAGPCWSLRDEIVDQRLGARPAPARFRSVPSSKRTSRTSRSSAILSCMSRFSRGERHQLVEARDHRAPARLGAPRAARRAPICGAGATRRARRARAEARARRSARHRGRSRRGRSAPAARRRQRGSARRRRRRRSRRAMRIASSGVGRSAA